MRINRTLLVGLGTFIAGAALATVVAGKKAPPPDPTPMFKGKTPKDAGATLLEEAERRAGGGSWERILVGRIYYLSGDKAKGQAIFDGIADKGGSDRWKIARVYAEAGDWDKAEPLFRHGVEADPDDDSGMAEFAAWLNLHGKRDEAEGLFAKALSHGEATGTAAVAAGSYLGVKPKN